MSLLRDDRLAALNELLVHCEDASLQYRDAVAYAPTPELAETLRRLAEQRSADAAALAEQVRALGDLPDVVDAEREWLRRVKAVAKAAVADDEQQRSERLRSEVVRLESALAEKAEQALATDIAGPARAVVQRLKVAARAAERRCRS